jgi:type VI protein secretion system component VasA
MQKNLKKYFQCTLFGQILANHFAYNFHVNEFLKIEVLKKKKKERTFSALKSHPKHHQPP